VPPTTPKLEAAVALVPQVNGDSGGEEPSPVQEDGLQEVHPPEEPPDKHKDNKTTPPKPNHYPEDPKFPKTFECKLCPRKFSFVNSLCTHVEIHHCDRFEHIKCDTNKFAAMLRLVEQWLRDKQEPDVKEEKVDEAPDVPEVEEVQHGKRRKRKTRKKILKFQLEEESNDQEPDPQEVDPASVVLEQDPASGKEMVDEVTEAVWEELSQEEAQEIIPEMEADFKVAEDRDKKLDKRERGKVKAEDSCGKDANLPEGWAKGGAKKLLMREPGELRDESSEEHQDLPNGWKVKPSKQAKVSKLEKVMTASPSKINPPVSTVQHKVGNGNFGSTAYLVTAKFFTSVGDSFELWLTKQHVDKRVDKFSSLSAPRL
jgi:hypothetical protein